MTPIHPIEPDESEEDTRALRIDPLLRAKGWDDVQTGARAKREVICPGRIAGAGRRTNKVSADYVMVYKGQKLAAMEAKKVSLGHTEGHGQALDYARRVGARFAYSTNGLKYREIDMVTGKERDVEPADFPTPDDLWGRVFPYDNDWRDLFGGVPFSSDGGKWEPRYYQHNAINAILEAIAKGDTRILLTLATGTGKTSVAFQVAWKLFKARWTLQGDRTRSPRVLFLADRNILADQAYLSFSGFSEDARARITPAEIRKRGSMPVNANVFFSIFQTLMTSGGEEVEEDAEVEVGAIRNYMEYPTDFFDLIIIDECHRAGARDETPWRDILTYFEPAVQLGLTATPRRDDNADSYKYFGDPVYSYSLKEGIEDGFLTPFKVRQMASTMDEYVYRPGDKIVKGEVEEGRTYTESDFNKTILIPERERARVAEFMGQIDPMQKTLVFCATQAHAAQVRDAINEMKPVADIEYCVRVTANDGEIGEAHLRAFQNNEKTIPAILTTSRKLSTGVDARNVRNIVLMRPVTSMIEFKQIVGRGTRTYEGKDFFTVYDFVKAYEHFQDPEWDGEPLEPVAKPDPKPRDPKEPKPDGDKPEPMQKAEVKLGGGMRRIQFIGSTLYNLKGEMVSAQDFLRHLFGELDGLIDDEEELRVKWSDPDLRKALLEQLSERGFGSNQLKEMARLVDAADSDMFDVLAHVRFNLEPMTRSERARDARENALPDYEQNMRDFLRDVLDAYERAGESELAYDKLGDFLRIRYGDISDAKAVLGDVASIRSHFAALQKDIYAGQ